MSDDRWEAGYQAAKVQAVKLARLYFDELNSISSENFTLDPERYKSGDGMRVAAKRFRAETTASDAAIFIAASINAMQPLGVNPPIEKIAAGFPTDGDSPEYGARFLAEDWPEEDWPGSDDEPIF
jgi:hypothetical protein